MPVLLISCCGGVQVLGVIVFLLSCLFAVLSPSTLGVDQVQWFHTVIAFGMALGMLFFAARALAAANRFHMTQVRNMVCCQRRSSPLSTCI